MAADTTETLLDNMAELLAAYHASDGSNRAVYDTVSAVAGMPFQTFRTRFPPVLAAWQAGYAAGIETVREGQIQEGKIVADTQGQIVADMVPRTMEGWSLNQHKRGYYRAFRKVGGKSRCVYIGTKFDAVQAQQKLVAVNASLAEQEVR